MPPDDHHQSELVTEGGAQRRQYYRLDYPQAERPTFRAPGFHCPVADVSERGVGLIIPLEHAAEFEPGSPVVGRIVFPRSEDVDVQGTVVRRIGEHVGVCLETATIPWATILEEQHFLLSKYKQRL